MLRCLVVLACLPSLARAQPCELEGTLSHDHYQVSVGNRSFRVRAREAHVRVTPMQREARVEVESSLRFTATSSGIPYYIRTRIEAEHGMLSLTPSVRIDHVRGADENLTARVRLNPWVHIRRVRLPCTAVTVDMDEAEDPAPLAEHPNSDALLRSRRRVLDVHATPSADAPRIGVRLERDAPFNLARIGRRGGWTHIEWTDGSSRIRGWARSENLAPSGRHGWGSTGGSGTPGCMPRGRASIVGGYEGPAEIAEGTEVLVAPDGARWATVASGRFVVRWGPHDTHAAIVEASGLGLETSCGMAHAFVPRSAVTPRPTSAQPP